MLGARVAPKILPNIEAVYAALEKQGCKFNRGWGGKIKVNNGAGEMVFADETTLLKCARDQIVKFIVMRDDGKAYAEKAAQEETPSFPSGLWFLPTPEQIPQPEPSPTTYAF
jgi:hypothetical protein